MNLQPIEKKTHREDGILDVFKIFPTIQGEGPFVGRPAVFVRLAGCNLQCPLCDTDYTSGRVKIPPEDLVKLVKVEAGPATLVVITGGEPFRQNLTPFVEGLLASGFQVQLETNGALYDPDFPYGLVTIVCSPKAGKIHSKLMPHIDALKYVLHADKIRPQDGLPLLALDHPAVPFVGRPDENFDGIIYLQPVDVGIPSENERHLKAVIESCTTFGYTLCLQIHKIISME